MPLMQQHPREFWWSLLDRAQAQRQSRILVLVDDDVSMPAAFVQVGKEVLAAARQQVAACVVWAHASPSAD